MRSNQSLFWGNYTAVALATASKSNKTEKASRLQHLIDASKAMIGKAEQPPKLFVADRQEDIIN